VRVSRQQESDVEGLFDAAGAIAVTTTADEGEGAWLDAAAPQSPDWTRITMSGLFAGDVDHGAIVSRLRPLEVADDPSTIRIETLADQVWERVWLNHFRAFEAAPGLWIVPHGQSAGPDAKVRIDLDPGLAFGTGTHPTTALCLQALCEADLSGAHVVDYGCGSGILSIAALKLGAARATALDIDPRAIDATRDNARRNGVGDRLWACRPDEITLDHTADLVIANILADTLKELAGELGRCLHRNGVLIMSGVLVDQADGVADAFANEFVIEVRRRDDWCMLIARPPARDDN